MNARHGTAPAVLFCLVLFLVVVADHAKGNGTDLPPARAVPGITAADAYPHACVDCHVDLPALGVDARFGTLIAKLADGVEPALLQKAQAATREGVTLKGRHPPAPSALENIPASCNPCHARGSRDAPVFAKLLHMIHLSDKPGNVFMTVYQGECTHCHKLDAATGTWSIPNAPEK